MKTVTVLIEAGIMSLEYLLHLQLEVGVFVAANGFVVLEAEGVEFQELSDVVLFGLHVEFDLDFLP